VFAPECTLADAIAALVATIEDLIVGHGAPRVHDGWPALCIFNDLVDAYDLDGPHDLWNGELYTCRHASEDHQHRSSRGPRPPSPPDPAKPGARTLKAGSAKPLVGVNGVKDFAQQKKRELQATEQEGLERETGPEPASWETDQRSRIQQHGVTQCTHGNRTASWYQALTRTPPQTESQHGGQSLPCRRSATAVTHCVEHQAETLCVAPAPLPPS